MAIDPEHQLQSTLGAMLQTPATRLMEYPVSLGLACRLLSTTITVLDKIDGLVQTAHMTEADGTYARRRVYARCDQLLSEAGVARVTTLARNHNATRARPKDTPSFVAKVCTEWTTTSDSGLVTGFLERKKLEESGTMWAGMCWESLLVSASGTHVQGDETDQMLDAFRVSMARAAWEGVGETCTTINALVSSILIPTAWEKSQQRGADAWGMWLRDVDGEYGRAEKCVELHAMFGWGATALDLQRELDIARTQIQVAAMAGIGRAHGRNEDAQEAKTTDDLLAFYVKITKASGERVGDWSRRNKDQDEECWKVQEMRGMKASRGT